MSGILKHTIWVVLPVVMLASCRNDHVLIEIDEKESEWRTGTDIAFNNGLIDNPVGTRSTYMLSDHNNTMGVWGWQYPDEGGANLLFDNQNISYTQDESKWTYSPVKYWDRKSSYRFYAYTPHSSTEPTSKVTIDPETGKISITGVTLTGCNNVTADGDYTLGNFRKVSDTDWMIDRSGQSTRGVWGNEVTFVMQHILSKLSVRVYREENVPDADVVPIRIDKMVIGDFICQGDFGQILTHTPLDEDPDDLANKISEWTPVDTLPRYTLNSIKNAYMPNHATTYILESLLIPQTAEGKELKIWYTVGHEGQHQENFYATTTLDTMFNWFVSGNSYVINIIFNKSAEVIKFDGGTTEWDDKAVVNRRIEI